MPRNRQGQPKATADEALRRRLEIVRERLERIWIYQAHSAEDDLETGESLADGFVHIDAELIEWIRDRISNWMTPEESVTFGQIVGRTRWQSWDHLPPVARNAIHSFLGMEFSLLAKLGQFPGIEEDPRNPRSRTKQYVLSQIQPEARTSERPRR